MGSTQYNTTIKDVFVFKEAMRRLNQDSWSPCRTGNGRPPAVKDLCWQQHQEAWKS